MFSKHNLKTVRSKASWLHWAKTASTDSMLFDTLINEVLEGQMEYARPACEIVRHAYDQNKSICDPYHHRFLKRLKEDTHPAISRCLLHCAQHLKLSEEQKGAWIEFLMPNINDRSKPIATRVFGMSALYNLVKDIPEIYDELAAEIRQGMEYESAAYISRGRKILNKTWK